MSTNHTSSYNLNQWVKSDRVLMSEFNADNAKIDAALSSLASSVSGKASASALSSLQSTVNGLKTSKADKTTVDSLTATVSQHTAALTKAGNCQLYTTNYTGTGGSGSDNQNSLTFPHKPFAVFLISGNYVISLFQGITGTRGIGSAYLTLSWSGNTLSWYSNSDLNQLNEKNARYHVFALLEL